MSKKESPYLLVPVELCKFAISEHIEPQFHTYLLLKYWSEGYCSLKKPLLGQLSRTLHKTPRTVRRHVKTLVDHEFLFLTGNSQFYIASWKKIQKHFSINYSVGVKSYPDKIVDPRAFCAGAVIGRLVNERRLSRKERPETVQKRKTSIPSPSYPSYQECATRALANICSISISKAHDLKQRAFSEGYIQLKKNLCPIFIEGVHISLLKNELEAFRNSFPEYSQIQLRKGKAYTVSSDLIWSKMKFKRSQNFL